MREGIDEAEASTGRTCTNTGLNTSLRLRASKIFSRKPWEVVGKQSVAIFHDPRRLATLVPRLLKPTAESRRFQEASLVRKDTSKFVDTLTARPLLRLREMVGCKGLTRRLGSI